MKLLLAFLALLISSPAVAQSIGAPVSYLSAANNNCTLVQKGATLYMDGLFINTTAAIYYLKLYDTTVTPSASLTPVRRIPVPFGTASAGGGVADTPAGGIMFPNGFGFCLTGAIADNDNTNAATGVTINFALH